MLFWAVLIKIENYHLRSILNYKHPGVISNSNLYRRCNSEPLSAYSLLGDAQPVIPPNLYSFVCEYYDDYSFGSPGNCQLKSRV